MRKLFFIFLLSFVLCSFTSNSANDYTYERFDIEAAQLKYEYNYLSSLIINAEEEKNIKMSDISNLPIISPIRTDSIRQIGDLYGWRKSHPILKVSKFHKGVDIIANENTAVYSSAKGIVKYINTSRFRYGNQVIIQHDNGYETRYAHLKEIFVQEGDSVSRYSILGTVGSTGLSTGPHLHYEIIHNEVQIDPASLFPTTTVQNKKNDYLNILIKMEEFNDKQLLSC